MKRIIFILFFVLIPQFSQAATRITSQPLEQLAIYPEVSIPASAMSINDSKISAEVRATVKVIPVLVGNTVERGEMLIELDVRDYKLNLLRAEVALEGVASRLKLAQYQLDQAKALIKEKAITDELLRQRQAEVTTLKSERDAQKVAVAMAKRDLKKCIIRAPFDAVVVERLAQVGELANPGSPLVRIVDISRIEVTAKIQPQDIDSLQNANHFVFLSQGKEYPLELRKLIPTIDPVQRNQEARFLFTAEKALPGSAGVLLWKQNIPHIPSNLIVKRNDKLGVFINNGSTAHFIALPDAKEGRPAAVNLALNASIIVNGRYNIQDKEQVKVEE